MSLKLEQCLNFILTKAQQSVHQLFKAELAPYEITPGQYAVLQCLWDNDGLTARQIADRLFLDGSTVTGMLDRMEHKDLVLRQVDPRDRRALKVCLTDKGLALKEPIGDAIVSANAKALDQFDSDQVQSLQKLLQSLSQ